MILHEFSDRTVGCNHRRNGAKGDLFCQTIVRIQYLHRMRSRSAEKRTPVDVCADSDFVLSVPVLFRELIRWHCLKFFASARPCVEIIPAVSFRRDQHIFRSLAVRITVKAHVLTDHAQNRARLELVFVVHSNCPAALVQIIRSRLRHQRINVDVLLTQWKRIHRQGKHMIRRKYRFDGRKVIEALPLADVIWPRQTLNRRLLHLVLKNFRHQEFVRHDGYVKCHARYGFRNAHHAPIFPQNGWNYPTQFESPLIPGWSCFNRCQPA